RRWGATPSPSLFPATASCPAPARSPAMAAASSAKSRCCGGKDSPCTETAPEYGRMRVRVQSTAVRGGIRPPGGGLMPPAPKHGGGFAMWFWFGFAVLALIGEVLTGTFYLLLFALGLAAAGITALSGGSLAWQIVTVS